MITKGKVVSLAYSLKNKDGEVLDQGDKNDPFAYLHGMNQIVPGLEKALEGLKKGDKKSVEIDPKDGYGEYDKALLVQVSKTQFPPSVQLREGMQFEGGAPDGAPLVFTIEKIETETVTVNGNHPLAGETLFFDVEVVEVRDATDDELTHGHAHGAGGHHHH